MNKAKQRQYLTRQYLSLLIAAGLIIFWHVWDSSALLVDQLYAPWLYPVLATGIMRLTTHIPFSLAAVLITIVPVASVIATLLRFQQSSGQHWARRLLACIYPPLAIMVFGYASFILLWGANYGRTSLVQQLGFPSNGITQHDLSSLNEVLLAIMQANRDHERQRKPALEALGLSLEKTSRDLNITAPPLPANIKHVPPGLLLRFVNTAGVISPWTLEAHVDNGLAETTWLALATHELAHLVGIADEGEASLIAAIAGLNADHSYARYSLALHLFIQVSAELPEDLREEFFERLSPQAQQDYQKVFEQISLHQPPAWLIRTQQAFYHRYLQGQGVAEGINSYNQVVQYLVMARKQGLF